MLMFSLCGGGGVGGKRARGRLGLGWDGRLGTVWAPNAWRIREGDCVDKLEIKELKKNRFSG